MRWGGEADGQRGRHVGLASPVMPADDWRGFGGGPAARAAVLPSALPGVAFVPYAESVPDGGRRGFEAAVAVRAPIV
jgi:hypothetical protein